MKGLSLRETAARKTIASESANITAMVISDAQLVKINQQTLVDFSKEQLFVFSILLIDDSITRNWTHYPESFQRTILSKEPRKGNWIGLTMLMGETEDHETKAKNQKARIFDAHLARTPTGNVGTIAEAYIPINAHTEAFVEDIKAGIHREVSIGVAVAEPTCSICGGDVRECPHIPGEDLDGNGQPMHIQMLGDAEAQEVSFVAVPGNYNAQVLSDTAGYIPMSEAFGRTVTKKEGTRMKKKAKGKESNAQKTSKAAADLSKELNALKKQMKTMESKLRKEARSPYGPDFDGDGIVDDADFDDDGDGVPDSIDSDGGRNPNGRDNDWKKVYDFDEEDEDDEDKQEEDDDEDDKQDEELDDEEENDDDEDKQEEDDEDKEEEDDDEDEDKKYTESIRTLSRSMKKMNEKMHRLTEQAKAGRMYQKSLLTETLRLGVLSKVIPLSKKETFKKTFARLSIEELKDFHETYKVEVDRRFPATGKSVALTENYDEHEQIKPATTSLNDIVAEFKR